MTPARPAGRVRAPAHREATAKAIRSLAAAALIALLTGSTAAVAGTRTAIVDLGGARAYVHADPAAPLAGVELFLRAGPDRQTGSQTGLAALVADAVLRTPVDGVPLAEAVDALGASITYAVSPQNVRFYLDGTPEALAAAAPLAARALGAPSFAPATLAAARASLAERSADDDVDPRLVGRAMLRSSYYRNGAGQPELGNAGALAAFTAADAKAFYDAWYRRGDAVVAAVGRTGAATDAAARALVTALPAGTAPPSALATRAFGAEPKRIVTHRDIGAPYVVLGFAAPPLGDKDFPAALVLRALLGGIFDRASATTLPPVFRPVGTIYGYDAAPAQLVLWINGARVDPDAGLTAVTAVAKAAAAKPIGASVLARYKDSARGAWTLETISLDERAFAIGNAVTHGLDADASDDVAAAIDRVTAADVQRVAKKYFQKFDVALVIPRSGS